MGNRNEYILSRHSKTLEIIYGQMLFILYPVGRLPELHARGERIHWDYLLYSDGGLRAIQ
jgi:hypothetical protein